MVVCFHVCSLLPIACFLYIAVQAHENHTHLPEGIGISGKNAKSFLGLSPYWCFDTRYESSCEAYHAQCHTEQVRNFLCTQAQRACTADQTCTLSLSDHWCPAHYQTICVPICEALGPGVSRCQNGGTCNNINSTYFSCDCVPGYTGSDCSTDINECESDPCQHAGVCKDLINDYNCTCPNRYDGKDCEIDRCKVGPADVIFLVDSSISQESENFNKQLNFIKDFVQSVYIGPNYVQVSVITFSFNATVEFDLTSHQDNSSILAAIDNIEYKPGATYTGSALSAARTVLLQSKRMVRKYVIVLTDGMSSDILDTKYQASLLKVAGVNIVAIGIGPHILHKELIDIADGRVFTVSNHDGLNNIQTQIGSYMCEVCLNDVSDVLYLLDASSSVALSEFQGALDALQHITSMLTIGRDKARVSLVRYATEPEVVFDFQKYTSAIEMQPKISVLYRYPIPANHSKALEFVYNNGFTNESGARQGKRHVIIFLTNGNNMDSEASNQFNVLKNEGKIVVAIGHGNFVNREKLLNISSYSYMFYHLGEDQYTDISVLNSLKGLLEYNTCNL
ncbi:hypothetical protein CHS0354_024642 [Potamilus streckersoni]|uniref:Uncharacterized protein n=1 Tax=Potamilus streckersoni TaxID=2493646 RepID=A0AAE0SVJ6_9BIVA|nr:hypothetical protein CHS0354_024642 [Potamilus streckersoni]